MSAARKVDAPELEPANDNAPAPRARRSPRLRIAAPLELPEDWEMKSGVPATRGDCKDGPRPCAYLSCRHHLWLRLQQEQPGNPQRGRQGPTTFRPSTMETCALDVADRGRASVEEVGALLGMDPTRVRQIENEAIERLLLAGVNVDELLEALLTE